MPEFAHQDLTELAAGIFAALGVPGDDARLVSRSLVESNLRGHDSHGVMRVPQYAGFLERGEYPKEAELRVVQGSPAVIVCDGQWGLGQVQAHRLLDLLAPKAREFGLAAGAFRNFGHIGRLGEYAERAAELRMVLIATVNNAGAGHRVAPPGGKEPRLGTNPLCIGVPGAGDADPVVLDFGTSVAAEGKVRVHHIAGRPAPEGWLLDHEGRPTTDPSVLYAPPFGSILPMGGTQSYKGFGLALVLDLLSGGLSGGRCCHPDAPAARGNDGLFLLLDPERFAGSDALSCQAALLTEYVRGTPCADGVERILLPGDPERATLARRLEHGIPLEPSHWEKLRELADRLGIPLPTPL